MKISIYSIASAVIFSSLYFSIVCFVRSKTMLTNRSYVTTFSVLYLVGFIRLLLPFDFVFTRGVTLKGLFSDLWKFIFESRTLFSVMHVSIVNCFLLCIGGISIHKLFFFIKRHITSMNRLKLRLTPLVNEKERISDDLYHDLSACNIHVFINQMTCSPFTAGFFKKYIIIPDIPLTDLELHYILRHEFEHIRRKDLIKKSFLQLFKIVFWWIPYSSFLCNDIEQLLEIQCDRSVISSLSAKEAGEYMSTLLHVAKKIAAIQNHHELSLSFVLLESGNSMIERFKLMTQENTKINFPCKFFITGILLLFIISYTAAPLPYYEFDPADTEIKGTILSDENSYLIFKNGKYFLVTNDIAMIKLPDNHAQNMIASGFKVKGD